MAFRLLLQQSRCLVLVRCNAAVALVKPERAGTLAGSVGITHGEDEKIAYAHVPAHGLAGGRLARVEPLRDEFVRPLLSDLHDSRAPWTRLVRDLGSAWHAGNLPCPCRARPAGFHRTSLHGKVENHVERRVDVADR